MIDEAVNHGLIIDKANYNHMVNGHKRGESSFNYVAPDASVKIHDPITAGWKPLEWAPKSAKFKEWPKRKALFGFYLPNSEPRLIPDDAYIHQSAMAKIKEDKTYTPSNILKRYHIIDVLQTG